MSALVLLDAEIFAGPVRVSGVANQVSFDAEAEEKDATVFTSGGWAAYLLGLKKAMVDTTGFFDPAPPEAGALAPDEQLFAQLGGAQLPITLCPTSADGSAAYVIGGRRMGIRTFGKVGDVVPFNSKAVGDGAVGRGNLIHPATVVRTTGSGTGNAVVLGALSSTRSLLVGIHVLTVAGGGTVTVTVQRDDNVGFSSPVTVVTTGALAAPAGLLTIVPGPITDDRYRITWTVAGAGASARFAVSVGATQ